MLYRVALMRFMLVTGLGAFGLIGLVSPAFAECEPTGQPGQMASSEWDTLDWLDGLSDDKLVAVINEDPCNLPPITVTPPSGGGGGFIGGPPPGGGGGGGGSGEGGGSGSGQAPEPPECASLRDNRPAGCGEDPGTTRYAKDGLSDNEFWDLVSSGVIDTDFLDYAQMLLQGDAYCAFGVLSIVGCQDNLALHAATVCDYFAAFPPDASACNAWKAMLLESYWNGVLNRRWHDLRSWRGCHSWHNAMNDFGCAV